MKIFDNSLYSLIEWIINIFVLNLLIILTSIPLITIFPSLSAAFSVVRNWKLHRDPSVLRAYFQYFKLNLKQDFLMHIIWFAVAFILYLNYFYLSQDQSTMGTIMRVPIIILTLLFIGMTSHLLAITAHYQLELKEKMKLAFTLTVTNARTLILLLTNIALLIGFFIFPLLFLILFSSGVYINFSICHEIYLKMKK